jgi:hypothetical protein
VHLGCPQVSIRSQQTAPHISRLAIPVDLNKSQLDNPVMGPGMKSGRLAIDNNEGMIV